MKKLFYLTAIVLLFSCKEKAKQEKEQVITMTEPTKQVIDSLVNDWYGQITIKPGGPTRTTDSVHVLSMDKEISGDTVYHIMFVISGTETMSVPEPPTPSKFSDTGRIDIAWRYSRWELLNKPQHNE